jgi:hypothetical protein
MLKYNNYPPKEPGDVEFTDYFIENPTSIDPKVAGKLVTRTLLEVMAPEDYSKAPAIITYAIDTSPSSARSEGLYNSRFCGPEDQQAFVRAVEFELKDQGLVGAIV